MGGGVSRQALSSHRKLLVRLAGPTSIEYSDTFWLRLASFPVQLSSLDPVEVGQFLAPFCQQIVVNSRTTQNFHKLILRVIGTVKACREAEPLLLAANSICLLRFLLKDLVEKLPGPELRSFIDGTQLGLVATTDPSAAEQVGLLRKLVESMVEVIVGSNISGPAYLLQLEAVRLLLVGCSTQLFIPLVSAPEGTHPVTDNLMKHGDVAGAILQTLMGWFVQRPVVPAGVSVFKRPENQQGVLRYVRSAAATVFWLPVAAYQFLVGSESGIPTSPLADSAQLLLLALVNHAPQAPTRNPFKAALADLTDVAYLGGEETPKSGPVMGSNPSVSYGALYEALGLTIVDERTTLLLYQLLQSCQPFREYVLVRSDLETLLIPVLRVMYNVNSQNQSELYLLSIILLILSQDASFGSNIHRTFVSGLEWYKERPLGRTSLGSFLIIILLRTAHQNLANMRDIYLHTNTIAALTNLAGSATGLSSHAAQRLLSLVELLGRKYVKLSGKTSLPVGPVSSMDSNDAGFQLQFVNDFLRILLELINGIVATSLPSNPELVYAILHRQNVLEDLRRFPQFEDVLQNIQLVPEFFNARIDEAKDLQPGVNWGVERVLEVVKSSSRSWRTERLRPFPELKFSYEEEQSPEEFFIPLVWTSIVSQSEVPWSMSSIVLFGHSVEGGGPAPSTQGSDSFSVDIPNAPPPPPAAAPITQPANGIHEIEESS
ncbi:hypothetical protein BSKO_01027 [Bryopsis sp. KO-2023]|nr:hypothetical protein BSKO_01027 [Bryopsis sp. KO-2023]